MRGMVIALVVMGLVLGSTWPESVSAQSELRATREEPSPAASLGWGLAAIGTNLFYFPAKIVYAFGGGLVGLLAWGVTAGDDDVALGILQPSLGGSWVVTPEMLRGEQPVLFIGPSYEAKAQH